MGQNFIITCDGQHPINQQAVGVLNGIESEGLVQHNDGWRGFSRTVNTHLYWDKFNPLSPQFRYVVLKLMDGNDQHHAERLRRFGVATASCLGAYTTVPDSYSFLPSWIQPCSFGRIQGELIRYAKSSPNLLSGTPAELLHKGILKGENCCMSIQGNSIIIKPATQSSTLSIKMWNSQRETSQSSLKLKQLPHPMPIQILYHVLFMLLSPTYPIMNQKKRPKSFSPTSMG